MHLHAYMHCMVATSQRAKIGLFDQSHAHICMHAACMQYVYAHIPCRNLRCHDCQCGRKSPIGDPDCTSDFDILIQASNAEWLWLQIIYSLRMGKSDAMAMFSVATSWWSLGMSIGKVVLLKDLIPYRKKKAKKVKQLLALVHGTDC